MTFYPSTVKDTIQKIEEIRAKSHENSISTLLREDKLEYHDLEKHLKILEWHVERRSAVAEKYNEARTSYWRLQHHAEIRGLDAFWQKYLQTMNDDDVIRMVNWGKVN